MIALAVTGNGEASKQVTCANFQQIKWNPDSPALTITCYADSVEIDSTGYSFSHQKNESVGAIFMAFNKKIRFLPENPAEVFPSIEAYDAGTCAIQALSKNNFKALSKMERIFLDNNEIETIDNDTFEDLFLLQFLYLRKYFFYLLSII